MRFFKSVFARRIMRFSRRHRLSSLVSPPFHLPKKHPPRSPVNFPALYGTEPFTTTHSTPDENMCGEEYEARHANSFSSQITMSAKAPFRICPRDFSPKRSAGAEAVVAACPFSNFAPWERYALPPLVAMAFIYFPCQLHALLLDKSILLIQFFQLKAPFFP